MNLNADLSRRAAMHPDALAWTPSPTPGVERRMLDRVGDEMARATSIVRYAPGSRFPAHDHDCGEEILVLDGIFQDETGRFPAGTYIRNPPGSRHAPGSEGGCTIFVKLRQFDPADRTSVRLDTAIVPAVPAEGRPGVTVRQLFRGSAEDVCIEHWAPGTSVALSPAPGGMELLILDGLCLIDREAFCRGSWLRLPDTDALYADNASGCTLWLKRGRHEASGQVDTGTA